MHGQTDLLNVCVTSDEQADGRLSLTLSLSPVSTVTDLRQSKLNFVDFLYCGDTRHGRGSNLHNPTQLNPLLRHPIQPSPLKIYNSKSNPILPIHIFTLDFDKQFDALQPHII
jgi:hypothetical protein